MTLVTVSYTDSVTSSSTSSVIVSDSVSECCHRASRLPGTVACRP